MDARKIMKFILAKKLDMTQRYDASGRYVPVTAVNAGPCLVLQVKTKENEGYNSVQVGFDSVRKTTKSEAGHQKGLSKDGQYIRFTREFRDEKAKFTRGDLINVEVFKAGDVIEVSGVSKGKGFAGVVKRHHFAGHGTTHGHKDAERAPGSIGAGGHQHVDKGRRMGGRMGNDNVTVKNLQIIEVDAVKNILYIKGPVPGARNSLLLIRGDGDMAAASNILVKKEVPQAEAVKDVANGAAQEATQ